MTTNAFQAPYMPAENYVWLGLWGLVGAFVLWKVAKGGPKGCWVALGFFGWWLYTVVMLYFTMFNPDWFDDRAEAYHMGAVVKAIQAGKAEVLLKDTTDFEWRAVCVIPTATYVHLNDGGEWDGLKGIIHDALGQTSFWRITLSLRPLQSEYDDVWMVFAVPNGTKVLNPRWDRLSYATRYEHALGGRYDVGVASASLPRKWRDACYLRDEAVLRFRKSV